LRASAETKFQEILPDVNTGAECRERRDHTFGAFVELIYFPVFERKWKESTRDTEGRALRHYLVKALAEKRMRDISRESWITWPTVAVRAS
jgi:hypothetical protein